MQLKRSHVELFTKATKDGYDARFVVSSSKADRVGDTFTPKALKKLAKTPKLIALWQHKADQPCGYWENFKMVGGELVASLKLADTNLAKMIRALLDSGVPLGASVGFRGLDYEPNKSSGYDFNDVDLMEISVVSTPANADAVLLAKQYGFDDSIFTVSKDASGLSESERVDALNTLNQSLTRIEKCLQSQKN